MGDVHAAKAAPSSRHWKVERLSEEEKAKLAFRTLTVPVGARGYGGLGRRRVGGHLHLKARTAVRREGQPLTVSLWILSLR